MLSNRWPQRLVALVTLAVACAPAYASLLLRQGFQVIRDHGIAWLQAPDGTRQWSFGVCVVDKGVKFEDYDEKNPAYAAWRYYPSQPAWAADAIERLKSGGFNTVGAWSDYSALLGVPSNRLMMTPIIHSGSSAGFPWLDMWDPKLVQVADDVTKGLIKSLKNDPRIIGYFSDNELGWWKPAVYDWIWKQRTPFTRQRTVDVFAKHYRLSWNKFSADFEVVGAHSWAELKRKGHPYLRANARGQAALSKVLTMLADRYYSLCRQLIKKYAPEALYLGDRYISNYYPEVATQAGRSCDVVSTNLNPDFSDGSFVHFYLQGLEALTHKPLMITEYYMTSRQGRSGNGNDRSGFPVVDTLAERADGFERTTKMLLHNPDVVGAHWFQYYDEPKNGRGDGENYNFGLVDTSNAPYSELLAKGEALDLNSEHGRAKELVYHSNLIPFLSTTPGDLSVWDRETDLITPDQLAPRGDLYASWNPVSLSLALVWPEERFGEQYFRGAKVPRSCLTTLDITLSGKTVMLRMDPLAKRVTAPAGWEVDFVAGTTSRMIVRIPCSAFGKSRFDLGEQLDLSAGLVSECRAYKTSWKIRRKLRAPR